MKNYFIIIFIVLASIFIRVTLLLNSQKYVDGDEAVIGIMAKHILEKGVHPVYFYGQSFNGGASIEAHISSVFFRIFGISPITLKLSAFLLSIILLVIIYFFTLKFWGSKIAMMSCFLFAIDPTTIRWNFKVRGSYIENLLLNVTITYFLFWYLLCSNENTSQNNKKQELLNNVFPLLFGFLSGVSLWNSEISLPFLILCFLFLFLYKKKFYSLKNLIFFHFFFVIGYFPAICFNFANGFENWRSNFNTIFKSSFHHAEMPIVLSIKRAFSFSVPSFFWHKNVDSFAGDLPIFPYIYFTIFLFSILWLTYKILSSCSLLKYSLPQVFQHRFKISSNTLKTTFLKELFILLHTIIYVLIYTLSIFNHISPRYLLPIQPFVIIIISITIIDLFNNNACLFKFVSISIVVIIFFISVIANYQVFQDKKVSDGMYEQDGEVIYEIIKFLKKEQIKCVLTDYFLQWRILFESKEEIISAYHGFGNSKIRYPEYEMAVRNCQKTAYVINKKSTYYKLIKKTLDISNVKYNEKIIKNISIMSLFSPLTS